MPCAIMAGIWVRKPALKETDMARIICIGECSLNITLRADGTPAEGVPGGIIARVAAIMARRGQQVFMASDAAADAIGDAVVQFLADAGVDTRSIDRFTEGRTPLNVRVPAAGGAEESVIRYEKYPDEAFDIIWPRIDPGDIVLYGGHYAIDGRMRPRLARLLEHAADRKAIMIYFPGFMPQQEPRLTRVMPAILENLEWAQTTVTRTADLPVLFSTADAAAAFADRVSFYCPVMINIDAASGTLTRYTAEGAAHFGNVDGNSPDAIAEAIADIVLALADKGVQ